MTANDLELIEKIVWAIRPIAARDSQVLRRLFGSRGRPRGIQRDLGVAVLKQHLRQDCVPLAEYLNNASGAGWLVTRKAGRQPARAKALEDAVRKGEHIYRHVGTTEAWEKATRLVLALRGAGLLSTPSTANQPGPFIPYLEQLERNGRKGPRCLHLALPESRVPIGSEADARPRQEVG